MQSYCNAITGHTYTLEILQVTQEELKRYDRYLKPEDLEKWVFNIGGIYYGFYDSREECQDKVNLLAN